MAFNLKKVLKALLFSTNQPLSIKEIQGAFTRFHEQAAADRIPSAAAPESTPLPSDPAALPPGAPALTAGATASDAAAPSTPGEPPAEAVEVAADAPDEAPELYLDVPSLVTAAQIRESMAEIRADLALADDGLVLIEGATGYRLATHPRVARWVRILRQDPAPMRLSQSAVETLAVVSYRQPVTRAEIESIRGVSADAGLNKLMERGLVGIIGKADLPGRPLQYGTTDQFLEFVGVKSLDELPASDVLSSRQIDAWLQTAVGPRPAGDAAMGLPDEELPLERRSDEPPALAGVTRPDGAAPPAPAAPETEAALPAESPA
jgi:segregation and condensation protein B